MKEASFIVKTLKDHGHEAYYAGGWVRDYILGHPSDDIDIATSASPEIVKSLFSHTIPIGLAFGIILVVINNKQYEVATFREDLEYLDGRRPSKIKYSSAKEDAKRRDFTINGMFYDPMEEKILDYVSGQEDLEKKIIKAIGNPHERIKEDRLRMIRAIRQSCRFGFEIEKETQQAIINHATDLFPSVAIERVWQEINKMAKYKGFKKALIMLFEFGLLQVIFPEIADLTLDQIKDKLYAIDDFPSKAPVIVSVLELFDHFSLQQRIDLCKYLKLSNQEIKFVSFLFQANRLIHNPNPSEDASWAFFYADPYANLVLQIEAIHIPATKRIDFLQENEERKETLQKYIRRIQMRDPVVKSEHLKLCNITPGKTMGILLKEAEMISINHKLESPQNIIDRLKKTKLWPIES